ARAGRAARARSAPRLVDRDRRVGGGRYAELVRYSFVSVRLVMAELDRAGKVLLRRRPAELVRLAHPGVRSLKPVPAEVVTANALADGVFGAREGRRRVLHLVELIAEPSSRAAREVVRRACALFAAFGCPVRITVLYLHAARDGRRAASSYALPLGGA